MPKSCSDELSIADEAVPCGLNSELETVAILELERTKSVCDNEFI